MRPSWDDTWIGVATTIARRSLCSRAEVGAVIVDSRHRIVSSGYNGPPHGFKHNNAPCTEWCARATNPPLTATGEPAYDLTYVNCPSLHAEANALMAADRSVWQDGTIYVTGHVCPGCAKLIGNSGLSRVVVQDDGDDREYRGYDESYRSLRDLGIRVEIVPPPNPPPLDEVPLMALNGRPAVVMTNHGWLGVTP